MRIFLDAIYGGLIGLLAGMLLDLSLASAFLDPVAPEPRWAVMTRMLAFWSVIVIAAVLGALVGWQRKKP